ncbi:adenylyltransferase [Yarrowia lipolytica]|uniref:Needs CLA4 to survive protein 3 n=1 Tax=Yarrowia lipolytica TaxID=4952 RepID=A0A371BZZ9_YARLL|nr:adenylyltransferase [Yarrowia lipolytica]RDW30500.1 adenylyltransferase [Yarrowia lipolytica]RDW37159.1 adenylyltransferase [Yarrowia lipolytica]RDW43622.1 adenylyltransferase [Yarrowia lipolytica]RDW50453.1 adenylyltransferase [Yarrowia lipolytica]
MDRSDSEKTDVLPMFKQEYGRYGRQMLVPEFGISGQLDLRSKRILVVGAGGLGSPAIQYLAGAGIGHITIIDDDTVEESNLHRQTIHAGNVNVPKAESAAEFVGKLNPCISVTPMVVRLSPSNSFSVFEGHDLVLDCTDGPAVRYLINDTAVLSGIPVVSASALKTEGQLSIYNYNGGPCYRCLFPIPPPADAVQTCGDGGIMGPVVGMMGMSQAMEAIKLLTGVYSESFTPFLMLYSAYNFPPWKSVKVRKRQKTCAACGDVPRISRQLIETGQVDYSEFCGSPSQVLLGEEHRITPEEYSKIVSTKHILLDVRERPQFDITSFPRSINIPWSELKHKEELDVQVGGSPVYVVCRYGNDSQNAVDKLQKLGIPSKDIKGGLYAWAKNVDEKFPIY